MSATIIEHEAVEEAVVESTAEAVSEEQLIGMLVDRTRSDGLQLTKQILESALEGEITDHVGYDKHDSMGRNRGNSRNGTRSKTVLTDVGPVEVTVPRESRTADTCVASRPRGCAARSAVLLRLSA